MKKFKKILSMCLAISMLASVATVSIASVSAADTNSCSGFIGDTDMSGSVSVKDATSIQKYAASISDLQKSNKIFADVNNDSKINVKDASSIQKYLAKVGDNGFYIGNALDVEGDNYEYWTEGIRSVAEKRTGYATVKVTDKAGNPIEGVKLGAWHSYSGAYLGAGLNPAYLEDEATTNAEGIATFTGTLKIDEAYIIQLYVTPEGYEWDSTFHPIMISSDNLAGSTAFEYEITLAESNGGVGVYTNALDGSNVAGVSFKVYTKQGEPVPISRTTAGLYFYDEEGKTDVEMIMGWKAFWDGDYSYLEIDNLPVGDYYLVPVTAPNGYDIQEKIEFSIESLYHNPLGVFRGYRCPSAAENSVNIICAEI